MVTMAVYTKRNRVSLFILSLACIASCYGFVSHPPSFAGGCANLITIQKNQVTTKSIPSIATTPFKTTATRTSSISTRLHNSFDTISELANLMGQATLTAPFLLILQDEACSNTWCMCRQFLSSFPFVVIAFWLQSKYYAADDKFLPPAFVMNGSSKGSNTSKKNKKYHTTAGPRSPIVALQYTNDENYNGGDNLNRRGKQPIYSPTDNVYAPKQAIANKNNTVIFKSLSNATEALLKDDSPQVVYCTFLDSIGENQSSKNVAIASKNDTSTTSTSSSTTTTTKTFPSPSLSRSPKQVTPVCRVIADRFVDDMTRLFSISSPVYNSSNNNNNRAALHTSFNFTNVLSDVVPDKQQTVSTLVGSETNNVVGMAALNLTTSVEEIEVKDPFLGADVNLEGRENVTMVQSNNLVSTIASASENPLSAKMDTKTAINNDTSAINLTNENIIMEEVVATENEKEENINVSEAKVATDLITTGDHTDIATSTTTSVTTNEDNKKDDTYTSFGILDEMLNDAAKIRYERANKEKNNSNQAEIEKKQKRDEEEEALRHYIQEQAAAELRGRLKTSAALKSALKPQPQKPISTLETLGMLSPTPGLRRSTPSSAASSPHSTAPKLSKIDLKKSDSPLLIRSSSHGLIRSNSKKKNEQSKVAENGMVLPNDDNVSLRDFSAKYAETVLGSTSIKNSDKGKAIGFLEATNQQADSDNKCDNDHADEPPKGWKIPVGNDDDDVVTKVTDIDTSVSSSDTNNKQKILSTKEFLSLKNVNFSASKNKHSNNIAMKKPSLLLLLLRRVTKICSGVILGAAMLLLLQRVFTFVMANQKLARISAKLTL